MAVEEESVAVPETEEGVKEAEHGYSGSENSSEAFSAEAVDQEVFHNVIPRSRNERKAMCDKDTLEKARLTMREGKDWDDEEKAAKLNPVVPLVGTIAYASESERFNTDFVGEDAERRTRDRLKAQEKLRVKRDHNFEREAARWSKMDGEWEEEQRYLESLRNTDKSNRNKNSVAYNPITLKYNESEAGKNLHYSDETIRYRAALRARFLDEKQNNLEYNIITGGAIPKRAGVPQKPTLDER